MQGCNMSFTRYFPLLLYCSLASTYSLLCLCGESSETVKSVNRSASGSLTIASSYVAVKVKMNGVNIRLERILYTKLSKCKQIMASSYLSLIL